MVRIRLPNKLVGTKKYSPMEQFWRLVSKRCPGKGVKRNEAVWVSPETCQILHDNELAWLKKRNRHLTKKSWGWNFGCHWLQVAPYEKEMRNGYAEINERRLYVKGNEKA